MKQKSKYDTEVASLQIKLDRLSRALDSIQKTLQYSETKQIVDLLVYYDSIRRELNKFRLALLKDKK